MNDVLTEHCSSNPDLSDDMEAVDCVCRQLRAASIRQSVIGAVHPICHWSPKFNQRRILTLCQTISSHNRMREIYFTVRGWLGFDQPWLGYANSKLHWCEDKNNHSTTRVPTVYVSYRPRVFVSQRDTHCCRRRRKWLRQRSQSLIYAIVSCDKPIIIARYCHIACGQRFQSNL